MEKIIEVVDEESFKNLVLILDEFTQVPLGKRAITYVRETPEPPTEQWVKYQLGKNILKITLKRKDGKF